MMKLYWTWLALTVLAAVEGSSPQSSAGIVKNFDKECLHAETAIKSKLDRAAQLDVSTEMIAIPMFGQTFPRDEPDLSECKPEGKGDVEDDVEDDVERDFECDVEGDVEGDVKGCITSICLYFPAYKAALDTSFFKTYKLAFDALNNRESPFKLSPLLVYPKLLHEAKELLPAVPNNQCDLDTLVKLGDSLTTLATTRQRNEAYDQFDYAWEDFAYYRIMDYNKKYAAAMTALDVTLPWSYKILELEMQYKMLKERLLQYLEFLENKSKNLEFLENKSKRVESIKTISESFEQAIVKAEAALVPKFDFSWKDPSVDGDVVDKVDVSVEVKKCRKFCENAANRLLDLANLLVKVLYDLHKYDEEQLTSMSADFQNSPLNGPRSKDRPEGGVLELELMAVHYFYIAEKIPYYPPMSLITVEKFRQAKEHLRLYTEHSGGDVVIPFIVSKVLLEAKVLVAKEVQREFRARLQAIWQFADQEQFADQDQPNVNSVRGRIAHFEALAKARGSTLGGKNLRTKQHNRRKGKRKLKGKKKGRHVHRR